MVTESDLGSSVLNREEVTKGLRTLGAGQGKGGGHRRGDTVISSHPFGSPGYRPVVGLNGGTLRHHNCPLLASRDPSRGAQRLAAFTNHAWRILSLRLILFHID